MVAVELTTCRGCADNRTDVCVHPLGRASNLTDQLLSSWVPDDLAFTLKTCPAHRVRKWWTTFALRPEQLGNWRAACSSSRGVPPTEWRGSSGDSGQDDRSMYNLAKERLHMSRTLACQRRGAGEVAGGSASWRRD